MASHEEESSESGQDIVQILALLRLGEITREDLGPENQVVLEYYLGLMIDDRRFSEAVKKRMEEINKFGKRTPLHYEDNLKKAKHSKDQQKKRDVAVSTQPSLWIDLDNNSTSQLIYKSDEEDPVTRVFEAAAEMDKRIPSKKTNKMFADEVSYYNNELRNKINLPVVRGKNPHLGDPVYKFLVKRVYRLDTFGIFREYRRLIIKSDIPDALNAKIDAVKGMVTGILQSDLPVRRRYGIYHEFVEKHSEEWNLL